MMAERLITAALENGIALIPTGGGDLEIVFRGHPDKNLIDMIVLHKSEILATLKARRPKQI